MRFSVAAYFVHKGHSTLFRGPADAEIAEIFSGSFWDDSRLALEFALFLKNFGLWQTLDRALAALEIATWRVPDTFVG